MSLDDEEQNRGNAPFNTFYSTTASEPWFPSGSRTGLWLETSQITPELNESHANDSHASPSDAKTGSSLLDVARQCTGMTVDQKELIVSSQKELRKKYPTLGLSGKIISANFHIPYDVSMSCDGEWVLKNRRGTSALFDSFSYLASEKTKWQEHTLVGGTGEIYRIPDSNASAWRASATVAATTNSHAPSQAAAPIPANARERDLQAHEVLEVTVSAADRQRLKDKVELEHGGKVELVWLADDIQDKGDMHLRDQQRWRQYGERELFTLFHYQQNEPNDGRAMRANWNWYKKMNEAFADAIVAIYKPGDIVLVHDYQLMLLPEMLRERVPTMYIGSFLHIPFPTSEVYRSLTMRKEVLKGALGSNTLCFQNEYDACNFSSACQRLLGSGAHFSGVKHGGVYTAVGDLAIGIDTEAIMKSAFGNAKIDEQMESLRQRHAGKKIIVGRDRLDSVRGVVQKLQAFEIFLELYPDWRGKVVLIQVTSPTRSEHCGEKPEKTENKISDLVSRINGKYGSLSYTPIELYSQYLARDEYFALLRIADVALITSVRDGMNTTALEYVVCQRDNHGPLIISEYSGTAGRLGAAMRINPWSFKGVAGTLDRALTRSPEVKAKAQELLYEYVTTNKVQTWVDRFVKRVLINLTLFSDQQKRTPLLNLDKLLSCYCNSRRRLFLFDYDGTLTPIVQDPQAAVPTDRIIHTLKTLAADPNNSVWIISGRDQEFLDKHFGHIATLGLSAEHGCFMRMPASGDSEPCAEWENLTQTLDMSWQNEVVEVFDRYVEIANGSFVERKKIAITWHYRKVDPVFGAQQAQLCQMELQNGVATRREVDVMTGKANVEVRPRFVNKGEIVKRLINAYGAEDREEPDFVLCLGDDHTDEDMFRAVRDSTLGDGRTFACTIGADTKQTLAKWHLTEPSFVIDALTELNNTDIDKLPRSGSGMFQAQL